MISDFGKKLKLAEAYAGITEAELARRIGCSPQALNNRIKTGRFTSDEMKRIAQALGADYVYGFQFPDGTFL